LLIFGEHFTESNTFRLKECQMDLETARLKLEPYNDSHYEGLKVMDSDPDMMRY